MAVKIEQVLLKSEDFVAFKVCCEGIPDRVITLSLDGIADGLITVEEEVEKAKAEAEIRLKRATAQKQALRDLEKM